MALVEAYYHEASSLSKVEGLHCFAHVLFLR